MIKKYSITIAGHATSFTLEPEFWAEIKTIAEAKKISIAALVAQIDAARGDNNLSSAIRVFVLRTVKSTS